MVRLGCVRPGLKMRQPNYHLRLHAGSPEPLVRAAAELLASGCPTPALFNDDVCIPSVVCALMVCGSDCMLGNAVKHHN